MAITRFRNSSIANKGPKYDNALAGLPYIPIIGTATDGGNGTSASVAFTGNNVAGAGITYTALSTPGSFTGTGTASPVTVTGLTAGTSYTFQVKAGNSLGDSAYSAASNSVTPVQPTAFDSIATFTGAASSTTFSSIPSTYQHLQLRINYLEPNGGQSLTMRFNGDTGTNYVYHALEGTGSSASAYAYTSQNAATIFSNNLNGTVLTYPNVMIIDIHDYASTTKNKTVRVFAGADKNGTGGGVQLLSNLWMSTSAITSLTVRDPSSLSWSSTTTIALYGIAG